MLQGTCIKRITNDRGQMIGYAIRTNKNKIINLSESYISSSIRAGKLEISNMTLDVNGALILLDENSSSYTDITREIILTILSTIRGNEKTLHFKFDTTIDYLIDRYKELKAAGKAYYSMQKLNSHLCIMREACIDSISVAGKSKENIQEECNNLAAEHKIIYAITSNNLYYLTGQYDINIISDKPIRLIDNTETGLLNGLIIDTIDFKGVLLSQSTITKKSFNNTKINKVLNFVM